MMLAMHPHPDKHHVPSLPPSLVTLSSLSQHNPRSQPSHLKLARPILSLNTAVPPTHFRSNGKASSLRLDTLSAVSPTARNTFSNGYEQPQTTILPTRPKLSIDPSVGNEEDFKDSPEQHSSRTPSNSSVSSASTPATECSAKVYYELPKGITSILVNSYLPRSNFSNMSSPVKRPGTLSKTVSFRDPLDEEIKTEKYTMAHSDIEMIDADSKIDASDSSDSSESTPTATSPAVALKSTPIKTSSDIQLPAAPTTSHYASPPPKTSRRLITRNSRKRSSPTIAGVKRDSSSDEDSDDSYAQTPVAGRCKKRREWVWTLDEPLKDTSRPQHGNHSSDDEIMSVSSRTTASSTG